MVALLLMIGLMIAFLFSSAIANIIFRWTETEEYSHGFIAFGVALIYLFHRRADFFRTQGQSSWLAVPLIAAGGALSFLGELGATFFLSQYGLILVLAGLSLALYGRRGFRLASPALMLLFVVVPVPYFLESLATARLQLLSTQAGVGLLHLAGISAYADGNMVDLGSYQLDVVEACAGLRYLFPLTGLAVIVAFLYKGAVWQRGLIILSAPPIAILMNIIRIAMIGMLVDFSGIAAAKGFVHLFEGWVIFMLCALLLLLEVAILNRLAHRRLAWHDLFLLPVVSAPVAGEVAGVMRLSRPLAGVVIALLLATPAVGFVRYRPPILPDHPPLLLFTTEIGDWRGRNVPLSKMETNFLGSPDYVNINYERSSEDYLNLFIAYYADQSQGISPHSPQVCLPGSGWVITGLSQISVRASGRELMVNRAVIEKGTDKQIVYYVFYQRGRWMTSEYRVKLALFQDALMRNRTDGALIRINAPVVSGRTEAQTDQMMQAFLGQALGPVVTFIPG